MVIAVDKKKRQVELLTLFSLCVYVVVQSAAFGSGWFLADDAQQLAYVNSAESLWTLFGADSFALFRPIKNFLFLLFTLLAPYGVDYCRACAVLIGMASFFPVRQLCCRCFDDELKGGVAAAVWLLSPTLVSSVAWLSCLNIQIMVAFAAMAIVAHDRSFGGNRKCCWISLSVVSTSVALLSYESAVCIPLAIIVFDLLLRPGRFRSKGAIVCYLVHLVVVALYLVVRHQVNGVNEVMGSFANTTRMQMACAAPYFTLQHFLSWFWPFGRFLAFGSFSWSPAVVPLLIGSFFACLVLGVASIVLAQKSRALSFGILLAFIAFGPTSNLLGFGNGPYGDYYMSFASVGLSISLTAIFFGAIDMAKRGSRVPLLIAFMLLGIRVVAVAEAHHWAANWSSEINAFVESMENFPEVFSNKIVVSQWLGDHGKYDEALALGDEVEAVVGAESGQMSVINIVRGLHALNVTKDADYAISCFQKSRFLRNGKKANRHFYIGCVLEDLKHDLAGAEREYRAAIPLRWDADTVAPANRLARLLAIRGDFKEAVELLERAHQVNPSDMNVLRNLETARKDLSKGGRL